MIDIKELKEYELDVLDYYERKHITMKWNGSDILEKFLEKIDNNKDCFIKVEYDNYLFWRDPKKQSIFRADKKDFLFPTHKQNDNFSIGTIFRTLEKWY